MIGRLTGTILDCAPGQVLLDVSGVGYALQIPLSTFYVLAEGSGRPASLHVHTHVREDALLLFGFASLEERGAFERLITISGVGPRLAIGILSGIGVDELRIAVEQQDRARLQKIPGVGKKTAERVLLELRDKMEAPVPEAGQRVGSDGTELGANRADAVSALINLGYPRDRASRAVESAAVELGSRAAVEALIKNALSKAVGR